MVAGIMGNGLSGYVNHKNNYKSYTFTLPPSFLLSLMCICFWTVVIFHLYVLKKVNKSYGDSYGVKAV